ncbi:MAG: PQQ-binding-like beta-propeller repeat protein, partial [Proteobacteria bacterium]|nr:PQQ-binding-like beta-propeller repeat protein [Pseudomonadota bacterium]
MNDPLADVFFRSVPINVEGALWVSYIRQNDLYIAVLDPFDGRLIRRTLLCSLHSVDVDTLNSFPLASADGVVYIPTGHGILFAIDASDYALRWANQYLPELRARPDGRLDRGSWLPGPPVVTGGLVLLTPTEETELLAFSASTGVLQWSVPAGGNSYVVAADNDRVWLGGRSIS